MAEKDQFSLIIVNPDADDQGKYSCEANGVPTTAFLYVDGMMNVIWGVFQWIEILTFRTSV